MGNDKPEAEFSDEHVIPRALGGNVAPANPFSLRVCVGCNSACGRWIDGRFARSWLIYNARATSARAAFSPKKDVIFPLVYIGPVEAWPRVDGTQCDFWLGPTGDHVYHFHKPYKDGAVFAGRPPHIRTDYIDAGTVYVAIVATNPEWHPILWRSVESAFRPKPMIHLVNGAPPGQRPPHPPVPPDKLSQLDWIKARSPDDMIVASVSFDLDFGERFLAKMALGIGSCVLGTHYPSSSYAALLRRALWERDRDARGQLDIHGAGFLKEKASLGAVLGWNGCHVIYLQPSANALVLTVLYYGAHQASIVVSTDPTQWAGVVSNDGLLWVIAPGMQLISGSMTVPQYVLAREDASKGMGPLVEIATAFASAVPVPPTHLEGAGLPPNAGASSPSAS